MNTYEEYKEIKEKQDIIINILSDKLQSFPKLGNGLVSEEVRLSDEYREVYKQYWKEFKIHQDINKRGYKLFKKQIQKEVEEKRRLITEKYKSTNH